MSKIRLTSVEIRKIRVRKKITGTQEKPRLSVYRSLGHIYVQAVDDISEKTIASACTLSEELKGKIDELNKIEQAKKVGELIAAKLIAKNIKSAVFDRGSRKYHGRIKALAESARTAGLQF
ncbi:MAG: 50S ribosomal protein L18 [Elusimicrobia bacterium RIFOXYA2_FULL_39_19]|nr:MAG: 50S ribosomal protein L18 [Elusimicrobia bacterium RIFOXYA2_FULL_39_19]